jgi:osmotically inducible lipoprotein OsmB
LFKRESARALFNFRKESAMKKHVFAVALALAAGVGLSACGSTGETVGTVGGAVVGGVVGSELSGGSTLGTVGGAAAGGYVGNKLGERWEQRH